MKIFKRIIVIVLVVALVAGGLYAYSVYRTGQTAQAAALSIETATLQNGEIKVTIGATGQVRSQQTAQLSWETSGQIDAVDAKVGDVVTRGQTLATLIQTSLPEDVILAQANLVSNQQALENLAATAAQERAKALANITTYEAEVRDARYELENFTVPSNQANLSTTDALAQAKQDLEVASAAFEPYRLASEYDDTREELLERLNTAQAYYNAAVKRLQYENNLKVAQANLDQAWSDFNKYKDGPNPSDVAAAQAKIAANQATLNQAVIKAPFDGTITTVSAKAGDQVSSNTSAFRLDDLSALYVDVSVSEVDIEQVQTGQPVTITLDALQGKSYQGTVSEVSQISTDTGTSVNFTVTVHVTNADKSVRPGMTAEVSIVTASKSNALLVPLQAVIQQDGKSVVYQVQTPMSRATGSQQAGQAGANMVGGYQTVTVTLGITSDSYAEVASGDLQAGDQVVINPDQLQSTLSSSSQSTRGGFGMFGMLGGMGGPPPDGGGSRQNSSSKSSGGNGASGGAQGGG